MEAIKPVSFALGAATGAVAAYLLDPADGRRRRSLVGDKAGRYGRRARHEAETEARQRAQSAQGTAVEAVKAATGTPDSSIGLLNDPALARKVESEILRPADAPRGAVNVNVENGVVYLRGEVSDPRWIERLTAAAREVDGVRDVESLMHTPDHPPPDRPGP